MYNFHLQPEGKTLEFKRDLSSPKPLLKTLVAFANTAGGRMIVGVANDRQVLGIANALDDEERLCSLIADNIAPRLVPDVEMITVEGKTLLVVPVVPPTEQVGATRPELRPESRLESALAVKVLGLLLEANAGKAELAKQLGHKSVSGELKKQITNLLTLEFIELTLPNIPNSPQQKYRLTDLGRE